MTNFPLKSNIFVLIYQLIIKNLIISMPIKLISQVKLKKPKSSVNLVLFSNEKFNTSKFEKVFISLNFHTLTIY